MSLLHLVLCWVAAVVGSPTAELKRDDAANKLAVLVDGREVSVEALRQKLKAAATRDKDQEVQIRGDRKTQFGVVAQVFDACLLAKLHSISIMARPDGAQPR